jgi:type I restriction enzyme S subunit
MTQTKLDTIASRTGKWKPYPAYKDSGVEWLGEIPVHWEVTSIKKLARPGYQTFTDGDWIEAPYITQEGIRLLQTGNVGIGEYKEQGFRYISEETFNTFGCTEVLPGDVLICRLADPVGRACIAPEIGVRMITSVDVCILKLHDNIDSHFVIYFLSSPQYLTWMQALCRGGTRDRVSRSMLGAIEFPILPFREQSAIASFLDHETARINTLVAKKERLIELLQEKRAALISQAVTKGLDPTVPMKDSGVEWLGEIPAHWEVKRLKFVATFYGGGTPSKEKLDFWSGDIPWVSPKDMKTEIVYDTEDHITKEAIESSSTRLVQPGAVLIVVRSGILRHMIPVATNIRPVAINQDMKAIVLDSFIKPEYFASVIRGHQNALLVEWRKEGATVESIEHELFVNTPCPIPPLSEQAAIIAHLNDETAKIDALISRIQEVIEKLKEYSSAIISAAVTGKIDVRGEIISQDDVGI